MYTLVQLKNAPEVKRIVQKADSSYKKHKAYLATFRPMRINSYWDGGSKDEYVMVSLDGNQVLPMPSDTHPYFDIAARGIQGGNDAIEIDHVGNITLKFIPTGYALVRKGYFCGKVATAFVYVNPENLTPFLPR
jgi:hypothetical protein